VRTAWARRPTRTTTGAFATPSVPSTRRPVTVSVRRLDVAPATVGDLVRALNLGGKRIAVERNGEIVPKGRYDDTSVGPEDRFEIVAAVGGG